jgi:adenylate kinase family enzyme
MIIHICGVSGSGKTTLGTKLKEQFGGKIVVQDTDNLRDEFVKKFGHFDRDKYQTYIDNFVRTNSSKPIIFVGLNTMPWLHKNHYYDMHSTHNYFIELDDETIIKQKCKRLLNYVAENDMDYLVKNNKKFIKNVAKAVADDCNLQKAIKYNKILNKQYLKQGYKFMSRDDIYDTVVGLLT